MTSVALFSDDRRYRYWLLRQWDPQKPAVAFIGLNPSTADEKINDPTIRRCIGFAERWGYGGLLMLNLYAYRSTIPSKMWKVHRRGGDIIGGERGYVMALMGYARQHGCEQTIAAWGNDKLDRHIALKSTPWKLDCLKINDDGQPGHVLYLPYLAERQPWNY
jgi:hypothetical protein